MKISKNHLENIILEEAKILIKRKNNKRINRFKKDETFKQDFIAGIVSMLSDDSRNIHSEWAFEVFKPSLKEKFGIKPAEAAELLQYMKNNQEISNNFYDNLKSVLIQLLPRNTKLLQDEPKYKPQLKNVRNPVPMGPKSTLPN